MKLRDYEVTCRVKNNKESQNPKHVTRNIELQTTNFKHLIKHKYRIFHTVSIIIHINIVFLHRI